MSRAVDCFVESLPRTRADGAVEWTWLMNNFRRVVEEWSFFSSFLGGLEKGVVPMSSMFAEKRVVFWGAFDARAPPAALLRPGKAQKYPPSC